MDDCIGYSRLCLLLPAAFEDGQLQIKENIRETIRDPEIVCKLLSQCGFIVETCADRLLEDSKHGATWFVVARKPGSIA